MTEQELHALIKNTLVGPMAGSAARLAADKLTPVLWPFVPQSEKPEPAKTEDLHEADPDCQHMVVAAPGGGIKCTKCRGWFCY